MKRLCPPLLSVVTAALLFTCVSTAYSEDSARQGAPSLTLRRALAEAYLKNPELEAVRAELRGVDETYVQAMAGFKPLVSGIADYTSAHSRYDALTSSSDAKSLSLEVTQSLYSGGSTTAGVSESDSKIKATRQKLKVTEQKILLESVTAYANFLRDQEIVRLRSNNQNVLEKHLKASNERFRLGNITKTDVSQAQSRLARVKASLIAAEGDLKKDRALFEQIIGLAPENLQKPEAAVVLPSEQAVLEAALKNNPSVIMARYMEEAAKASTRAIEGERLPQVDLTGALDRVYDPVSVASEDETARSIRIVATLPLYAGGGTVSRIREARHIENQRHMEAYSAERIVRQTVTAAWEDYVAAEAETQALQSQVDAAQMALRGVKAEADYGSRTTLDLLDAEQEYLDAQVGYAAAETARIIASYSLMSAAGNLTAEGVQLEVAVYDPVINFQNIKTKQFHWSFFTLRQ